MEASVNTLQIDSRLHSPNYEYLIKKVLGRGAFGVTYLAETTVKTTVSIAGPLGNVDREVQSTMQVAIKEFFMRDFCGRQEDGTITDPSSSSMVSDYRRKFRREAENLSVMHHPNIVRVIEVFDANNTSYYAMEYIEGESLDDYIKSKTYIPEEEAIEELHAIADALTYMHQQHMLHLDLKPKNIMRRQKDGKLFLIDFGLSKHYKESGEAESDTSIGLGTPGYAPLEQAIRQRGQTFPAYIDVYALGATFYKMLSGNTPPSAADVMNDGLPIDLMRENGTSDKTIRVIQKAMASRRQERYQSVEEMMKALDAPDVPEETDDQPSAEIHEEAEPIVVGMEREPSVTPVDDIVAEEVSVFEGDSEAEVAEIAGEQPAVMNEPIPTGSVPPTPPQQGFSQESYPANNGYSMGYQTYGATPDTNGNIETEDPGMMEEQDDTTSGGSGGKWLRFILILLITASLCFFGPMLYKRLTHHDKAPVRNYDDVEQVDRTKKDSVKQKATTPTPNEGKKGKKASLSTNKGKGNAANGGW